MDEAIIADLVKMRKFFYDHPGLNLTGAALSCMKEINTNMVDALAVASRALWADGYLGSVYRTDRGYDYEHILSMVDSEYIDLCDRRRDYGQTTSQEICNYIVNSEYIELCDRRRDYKRRKRAQEALKGACHFAGLYDMRTRKFEDADYDVSDPVGEQAFITDLRQLGGMYLDAMARIDDFDDMRVSIYKYSICDEIVPCIRTIQTHLYGLSKSVLLAMKNHLQEAMNYASKGGCVSIASSLQKVNSVWSKVATLSQKDQNVLNQYMKWLSDRMSLCFGIDVEDFVGMYDFYQAME